MAGVRDFLGRGFSFPPRVDSATGRFVMCSDDEDIKQSIYIILMTRTGERAMLPDFGCDIHNYVFDLPDDTCMNLMSTEIVRALAEWEPRILNVTVSFDLDKMKDGIVYLDVGYIVRATNNPNNLVFPYYLYEGVGIE